jgi:hypothetical protein
MHHADAKCGHYRVQGDVGGRRVRVGREEVACRGGK